MEVNNMKNSDIYQFLANEKVLNDIKSNKVKCSIFRNMKKLESEKDVLHKLLDPTDEFKEYEKERLDLNERYTKKKKVVNGKEVYDIPKDKREEYDKEMAEFTDNNKEVLDARDKQVNDFNQLLTEPMSEDVEISKVSMDDCESLTYEQMKIIDFMIDY